MRSPMTSPSIHGGACIQAVFMGEFCDGPRIIGDVSYERHLATRKNYTTQRHVNMFSQFFDFRQIDWGPSQGVRGSFLSAKLGFPGLFHRSGLENRPFFFKKYPNINNAHLCNQSLARELESAPSRRSKCSKAARAQHSSP